MLYFATSNQNKFKEVKDLLPDLLQLKMSLPEIQSMDLLEIAKYKLQMAFAKSGEPVIVDDTGLYLECLNGFPGPMIKYLLETNQANGIYNIVKLYGCNNAIAKTVVGYIDANQIQFFEGYVEGKIVEPIVDKGFGWDSIFVPNGQLQTYAQMGLNNKNLISHRFKAIEKFREFYLTVLS